MKHRRFLVPLAALAAALTSGCGAGASASSAEAAPRDPALADVIFEGDVDEAQLKALLAVAPPKTDPARGAVIDAPSNDALLPRDRVATFQWHDRGEPASAKGLAYLLVYSTDADSKLLRVFTDKPAYTPGEDAWAKLEGARTWTTFGVLTASFAGDALAAGGGPFAGGAIDFCIEP